MKLFRNIINKIAAKHISKQIDLSKNEIYEFLQNTDRFNKIDFEKFVLEKRAQNKKISLNVYLKLLNEEGDYLTYEEFIIKHLSEEVGLSVDEYKNFLKFKEKNLGKNDINDDNIIDYFKASLLNLDIKYYYKYIRQNDKSLSPEEFMDIEISKEKGISLQKYLLIKESKKLNLTIKEYQDYLYAKSQGLSLEAYYYLEYLNSKSFNSDEFISVSTNDELVAVNEAKLENIILLKNHTYIDYTVSLFKDKNIVIADGVNYINSLIINNLNQDTIIIPKSVKNIDNRFFNALEKSKINKAYILSDINIQPLCTLNLKKVYLTNEVFYKNYLNFKETVYKLIYDDKLAAIGAFINSDERKCYIIPGTNVTSDLSFLNDYEVVNIEISSCVNIINKNAFANLERVKHLIINDKLLNAEDIILPLGCSIIYNNSFHNNLEVSIKGKNITFNDVFLIDKGIKEITPYEYAGINCKSIIIPESVKKIEEMAFANSKINNIYFKGALKYKADSFLNCEIHNIYQDEPFINSNLGFSENYISYIDLDGITFIKQNAFDNLTVSEIEIPSSVKEIESFGISSSRAFKVIIKDDVKLHKNAFGKKVNSIVFEKISKDNINEFLNKSNMNLESVTLPSNIDIETFKLFFNDVKGLKNIYITGTEKPSISSRGIFDKKINAQFKHIEFPECVSQIDKNVFISSGMQIKKLVFPDNIIDLSFSKLIFNDNNVNVIGSNELVKKMDKVIKLNYHSLCPKLIDVIFIDKPSDFEKITLENRNLIKEIVVGEKIEEIPSYAFAYMTHLKKVTFKGLIKKIGEYSFAYCNRLTFIELSPTTNRICKGAFLGAISLEKIIGFDSVEVIEKSAFENCVNLKSLVFSSSIRVIENCIKGCVNLKLFVVPSSCDKIELLFEAKESIVYLPRFIHNCHLETYLGYYESPKVHCPKNKNWSFSTSYQGYSLYKLEEFKNAVNEIIKPYGFAVLETESKKKLHNFSNDNFISGENPFDTLDLHSIDSSIGRASFNVISKDQSTEDFVETPTSINDIIEEIEVNNDLKIETVERKNGIGSYDVINNDVEISFNDKYKLITNNVFSIPLNINGKLNDIYIGVINDCGVLVTDLYKVLIGEKRCIAKISMTLLPGQKNGKYYLVVSLSNKIEDNIIYKEEVEIKIAFSLDDDFDL